jgi:hypothetical protein
MKRTLLVPFLAIAFGSSCSPESDPRSIGENSADLHGTPTSVRPEIGVLYGPYGDCTATAFLPQYIITAAHCVNFISATPSSTAYRFFANSGAWGPFYADKVHSFSARLDATLSPTQGGKGTLKDDIAILHLTQPVTSSGVTPAALSLRRPWTELVTLFGLGCYNRGGTDFGTERYVMLTYPSNTSYLCPGDSGGPDVLGAYYNNGMIWGVNSGFDVNSGYDQFADVAIMKQEIEGVYHQWENMDDESEVDRPGSDYYDFDANPASVLTCLSACISDRQCHGYSYTEAGVVRPAAHCWLKGAVADWVPKAGVTSGIIRSPEYYVDRPGNDYTNFPLSDARSELCAAACAADQYCEAYTYVQPTTQQPSPWCWLKGGVPAVAYNPNTTSGVKRSFEGATDRPGFDYSSFESSNAYACSLQCAQDERCRAFTYTTPPGAVVGTCYLKNQVPNPTAAANDVISAVKRGMDVGVERAGGDYRDFSMNYRSPELCQATCAQEAQCAAWSFSPGTANTSAHCWLKSTVTPQMSAPAYLSGIKGFDFF